MDAQNIPPRLSLRGITKRYAATVANSDVSLTIGPGEIHALLGENGAGKSTLVKIIYGVVRPDAGEIRWEGAAVEIPDPNAARRLGVGMVFQHFSLFESLTVAENIALGRSGATREEIIAAAKAAHAHDFIMGFDRGYDSPVGEQGMQVSGGQRQRIAIARAFIKNAPIILLDEATSALDSESERAVQQALQELCAGRTTIVIAHRLSTIVRADKICVLENGQLVEVGRHDELMARGGVYRKLHEISEQADDLVDV